MDFEKRWLLDREALDWFNAQVYGAACYHPDNWYGAPSRLCLYGRESRSRNGEISIDSRCKAFEQAWKFYPDPYGRVPMPRVLKNGSVR